MAFADDKQAVIDLVLLQQCNQANYIDDNASDYPELLDMVIQFASTFDCDPAYLTTLLGLIADGIRTSNGVYLGKSGTVSNPVLVVDCAYTAITVDSGGDYDDLLIFNSTVDELDITTNTNVKLLNVGGGSVISLLDVESGSSVGVLLIKSCNGNNSEITKIKEGSSISELGIDEDAEFGGFTCEAALP